MRTIYVPLILSAILFTGIARPVAADESVDLFDAQKSGDVSVRFIALSAEQANVLIENKTDDELLIRLPEAIAAVPVLAQFGQNPQGGGNAAGGGGGQSQSVGGGIDPGGIGPGGVGPGGVGQGFGIGNGNNVGAGGGGQRNGQVGGFMRIGPQRKRKLTARTVCLEHGKRDPNPRIAYRMIPVGEYTDDDRIFELCRRLGKGDVGQSEAQAVAWKLANGLSWEKLASLNRIESRYRGEIKYFDTADLTKAKQLAMSLEASLAHRTTAIVSKIRGAYDRPAFRLLDGE